MPDQVQQLSTSFVPVYFSSMSLFCPLAGGEIPRNQRGQLLFFAIVPVTYTTHKTSTLSPNSSNYLVSFSSQD